MRKHGAQRCITSLFSRHLWSTSKPGSCSCRAHQSSPPKGDAPRDLPVCASLQSSRLHRSSLLSLRCLSSFRVHYRNESPHPRHEVPRSDSMWTRRPAHSSSEPPSSHLNARRPHVTAKSPLCHPSSPFDSLRRPSMAFVVSNGRLVASRVTNPRRVRSREPLTESSA